MGAVSMAAFKRFADAPALEKWRKIQRVPARLKGASMDRRWRRIADRGKDFLLVDGRETFLVSTHDDCVGRGIFKKGEFDFEKFQVALEILGTSKVRSLVDVGANIGVITIPALCRGFAERAVAIEPDPLNFWLLEVNSRLNGVEERIECIQAAASRKGDGVAQLELAPRNSGDHRIARASGVRPSHPETVSVPTVRLDDVVGPVGTGDLVWMDVQGYEMEVLQGAPNVMNSGAALVIEIWPLGLIEHGELNSVSDLLEPYDYFFDLNVLQPYPRPIKEVQALIDDLGTGGPFTDILCLRAG